MAIGSQVLWSTKTPSIFIAYSKCWDLLLESSWRLGFPGEAVEIQFTSSKTSAVRQFCWEAEDGPPAGGGARAPLPGWLLLASGHDVCVDADTARASWLDFRKKTEADKGCLLARGSRVRLYLELWHGRMPQLWRGDKNSATLLQLAFPAPSGSHSTCAFLDGPSERSNFACAQWGEAYHPAPGFEFHRRSQMLRGQVFSA